VAVAEASIDPKVFRVLSLDGGGAKVFYTLRALKEIEALELTEALNRVDP
jgi:hypothetical protein